jgi:hypothetical protein
MTQPDRNDIELVAILHRTLQETGEDTSDWDGANHWAGRRPITDLAEEVFEAVAELRRDYKEAGGG